MNKELNINSHPLGSKGPRFRAMPNGAIETVIQRIRKLVYGRADRMPNSLESMVVCGCDLSIMTYKWRKRENLAMQLHNFPRIYIMS